MRFLEIAVHPVFGGFPQIKHLPLITRERLRIIQPASDNFLSLPLAGGETACLLISMRHHIPSMNRDDTSSLRLL